MRGTCVELKLKTQWTWKFHSFLFPTRLHRKHKPFPYSRSQKANADIEIPVISNLSRPTLSRAFSRILDSKKDKALPLLKPGTQKHCVYQPKEADIAIKKTEQNTINKGQWQRSFTRFTEVIRVCGAFDRWNNKTLRIRGLSYFCVFARFWHTHREETQKLAGAHPIPASLPYQTFMGMQAAVAARLRNMRGIAQHPSIARLIHSTGGAPRVTAVMAIWKGQRKPWLCGGIQPCLLE